MNVGYVIETIPQASVRVNGFVILNMVSDLASAIAVTTVAVTV